MLTIQEVNSSICFGNFTNDQLDAVIAAVKYRRNTLTQEAKRAFRLGSAVKFYSSKRGQTFTGTVEKVATKYLTIRTSQGLWKVPGNMLEAA